MVPKENALKYLNPSSLQFSSVQLLSHVWLFVDKDLP